MNRNELRKRSKGGIYRGKKYPKVETGKPVYDRSKSVGYVDRNSIDLGLKKTGHKLWFGLKRSYKKRTYKKRSNKKRTYKKRSNKKRSNKKKSKRSC